MTTPAKLVQLIRNHGHEACVKRGKKLHVSCYVVLPNGGYELRYFDIPATLPAVLRWLGY